MSVSERIRRAASDNGMTLKEFSSAIGISYRTVQNYVAEERNVGAEFLAAASERLGVSASWLLTGHGPAVLPEKHPYEVSTQSDYTPIPRHTVEASASHGASVGDETATEFIALHKDWLSARNLSADRLAVLSIKGDSMEPDLKDGDLILIDRAQAEPRAMDEGHIYVVRFDDDLFVKRVQHLPGNRLMLLSSNPVYHHVTVEPPDLDGVRIIGRVVYSTHRW